MRKISFSGKSYDVDEIGFLLDPGKWDEEFAETMAPELSIDAGLSEKHWSVIKYIRNTFDATDDCPTVYQTCRAAGLSLRELEKLFPSGYLRGACLLAGATYKDRFIGSRGKTKVSSPEKVYRVDVYGFLVDAAEWDENFATIRAQDMKISQGLTEKHWQVIHFLRDYFEKWNRVPTVFECCEANGMELDELERLFPDGYHRGAVKVAGLRVL